MVNNCRSRYSLPRKQYKICSRHHSLAVRKRFSTWSKEGRGWIATTVLPEYWRCVLFSLHLAWKPSRWITDAWFSRHKWYTNTHTQSEKLSYYHAEVLNSSIFLGGHAPRPPYKRACFRTQTFHTLRSTTCAWATTLFWLRPWASSNLAHNTLHFLVYWLESAREVVQLSDNKLTPFGRITFRQNFGCFTTWNNIRISE